MQTGFILPVPTSLPAWYRSKNWVTAGIVLMLTIIGLPLGVVFIASYLGLGMTMKKNTCPVCHNEILRSKFSFDKALTCCYCRRRLLVKNNTLVRVK